MANRPKQSLYPAIPTGSDPADMPHSSDSDISASNKPSDNHGEYILVGNKMKAPELAAGLYIVSTPIGNLRDITIRGLEILSAASMIACEDTRVSRKLLSHYGIRTRLITYHEHNADKQRPAILRALAEGQSVALISDAGTPLLSDPGYKLVNDIIAGGYDIIPIPGASAMLAGLVAAGLPTDQVHFAGFLPQKAGARGSKLESLKAIPGTLVFYESPRRLAVVLDAMKDILGADRQAVIAREVTKRFEEFRRGSLSELAIFYASQEAPKGEAVILLGPAPKIQPDEEDIDAMLIEGLKQGLHVKQLSAEIAGKTGQKKNVLYKRAQYLKDGLDL